jgi:FAD:protein FMN transferase
MSECFRALGTTVTVVTVDPDAGREAAAAVSAELAAFDEACSRFRDSELTRVNRSGGRVVSVGPILLEALRTAIAAARDTYGLVDPTIGRALRLAGYDRTFHEVAARNASSFTPRFCVVSGWSAIELDTVRSTVRVPRGVELDLGSTGKALAADRAAAAASRAIGGAVLVGLGGDIAVAGAPQGGWPVRIADDHATPLSAPGPVVAIESGGLATSSTSVRRWRAGAHHLHHLFDPRTGRPAVTRWRTVSVAAASCAAANAASTAAFMLDGEAPAWLRDRRLPARLEAGDGTTELVAGWPEDGA